MPDDLAYQEIMETAMPYLGQFVSKAVDWTPLKNRMDLFARFGKPTPLPEDVWQFESFLV